MSSILKALKKAEGAQQPEPRGTEDWSHTFEAAEAIRKRARRSRDLRMPAGILALVLLLGGGAWWIAGQRSAGTAASSILAREPAEATEARERTAQEAPRARVVVPRAPAPDEATETGPAPSGPVRHAAASSKEPARRPETEPEAAEPPPPAEGARAAAAPEPSAPAGRLDGGRFRLEAIVWSNNAESRFAVINGNILREGGTVDGVTITAIERNSVRIRSGSDVGEIRFQVE